MLTEEALVLFAATGACALLILGVLELVTPTRSRRVPVRVTPARDPWRRARTGPAPMRPVTTPRPSEPAAADVEPPIERILLSEAATLAASASPRGPFIPPLPPPREPGGFEFLSRRPVMPSPPSPLPPPVVRKPAEEDRAPVVPAAPVVEAPPAPAPESIVEAAPLLEPAPAMEASAEVAAPADLGAPTEVEIADADLEILPDIDVAPRVDADAPVRPSVAEIWDPAIAPEEVEPDRAAHVDPEPKIEPAAFELARASKVSQPVDPSAEGFVVLDGLGDLTAAMAAPAAPASHGAPLAADEHARSGPSSVVDRCYGLYEAKQYADALAEAVPVLDSVAGGTLFLESRDAARLWGLAGLARQALGDHDGARTAFEEAVTAAPTEERPTWQRHLGSLALHVGEQLFAHSQSTTADAEGRVTMLRTAITWLEGGRAASPGDSGLRDAAANARSMLWPTYEQVCGELIQRQDYNLARQLLRQAIADKDCPVQAQGTFGDLLATTFSGEVGQLTAEAIRRMQEGREEDAVATLDRAEALLATIPAEAVQDKRRQELERRLWWSYTKVGMRRLDGGMYEEALGPLLHALHFGSVGPERLEETKRPLARALESIAEVRSPLIQRLAADGDRDGALVLCEKLWTFLRSALERGMTREELATAFNRTQALFEKLGKSKK